MIVIAGEGDWSRRGRGEHILTRVWRVQQRALNNKGHPDHRYISTNNYPSLLLPPSQPYLIQHQLQSFNGFPIIQTTGTGFLRPKSPYYLTGLYRRSANTHTQAVNVKMLLLNGLDFLQGRPQRGRAPWLQTCENPVSNLSIFKKSM